MGKKKKWSLAYSPVDAHCLETLLSMGYARDTARRALEDPKSPDGISLRDLVGDLRELYNGATEPPAVSEEQHSDEALPTEGMPNVDDHEAAPESDDDEWEWQRIL